MINLVEPIRGDTCIRCMSERSLELYDDKDNPVRYSVLLDNNNQNILKNRKLRYFKCRKCGSVFDLNWIHKDYPIPLTNSTIKDFIREYDKK